MTETPEQADHDEEITVSREALRGFVRAAFFAGLVLGVVASLFVAAMVIGR